MKRLIDLGVVALFVVAAVGCGKKQDGSSASTPKTTPVAPVVNVTGNQPPVTGNGVDADCQNEKAAPPHQVGVFTFEENFNNPKGPGFFNTCWYTYTSSKFRVLSENTGKGEFRGAHYWTHAASFKDVPSRELAIQPHASMAYPADDLKHYGMSPPFPQIGSVKDAIKGQVPWMMDLRFDPVFYAKAQKVDITVPLLPVVDGTKDTVAGESATFGVILNGKVTGTDAAQKLTGYVILVKTSLRGADKILSTQLVALKDAPEFWTDYAYLQYPGAVPPLVGNRIQDNPLRPTSTNQGSAVKLFDYKEVKGVGVEELTVVASIERNVNAAGEATITYAVQKAGVDVAGTRQTRTLATEHVLPLGGGYGYLTAEEYGTSAAGGSRSRSQLAVRNLKISTSKFAK